VQTPEVDLNADLGEGFGAWDLGDDDALLAVVTSANVACGFHAGDPLRLRKVCAGAAARGVTVGAQVSYPDLVGFGRRPMEVPADQLAADVIYQIGALDACARAEGTRVRYVKPHGALYHRVIHDADQAFGVASAIAALDPTLPLLTAPSGRLWAAAAELGLRCVAEAFPDRGYAADGTLLPRRHPAALVADPADVAARAVRLAVDGVVEAVDGSLLQLDVASLCLHGDSPGAAEAGRAVREALVAAGVTTVAFA
jgi:UPF0271 protein